LRATEALESARVAAGTAAGDATLHAEAEVALAERRLNEVEATLVAQFNRFCGIRESLLEARVTQAAQLTQPGAPRGQP
jgi:hypothetical protein